MPDRIQTRSTYSPADCVNTSRLNLIFPWNFHPTAENRHSKALFKETPCSLIIQTDFLKPLMNNGARDEKIAIAKKYSAFPQQRTFARLYSLLKMGHHIMKSRNKLVNDIRAIATGDTFWVLTPGQYHRKQISLFCSPIITCCHLHSGEWCCSLHVFNRRNTLMIFFFRLLISQFERRKCKRNQNKRKGCEENTLHKDFALGIWKLISSQGKKEAKARFINKPD